MLLKVTYAALEPLRRLTYASLADWNFGDGEALFKAVTKISSFWVYAISRRGIVQLGVLLVPFSFSSL